MSFRFVEGFRAGTYKFVKSVHLVGFIIKKNDNLIIALLTINGKRCYDKVFSDVSVYRHMLLRQVF